MNVPDAISERWHDKLDYYMRLFYLIPQELTYNEKMLLFNHSLKITFVRHPFGRYTHNTRESAVAKKWEISSRLVSLYEDHVLYHTNTEFHLTLKKVYNDTSFRSFSRLILDMARDKKHGFGQCNKFSMGGHLMPYHHCCAPCDVEYDVIGLTEDFKDDFKYITTKVKFADLF